MRPPTEPMEIHGPVWAMEAVACGTCAAELGMFLSTQVLDQESN